MENKSVFKGTALGLFGHVLLGSLLTSVTCGIMAPWAVCYVAEYVASNSYVSGRQLEFKGTFGGLFGSYIKWFLLSIVTCGIYSFWLVGNMVKWMISNLHFADNQGALTSEYTGSALSVFGYCFLSGLLSSVTCGIAAPWAIAMLLKNILSQAVIDGEKLTNDCNGGSFFVTYFVGLILSGITCGIYGIWFAAKVVGWVVEHTSAPEAAPAE